MNSGANWWATVRSEPCSDNSGELTGADRCWNWFLVKATA